LVSMFGYHGVVWLCKKGCQHRHSNHESVTLRWGYIHCDRLRTTVVQALKHVGVGPRTISSRPRPRIAGKKAIQVRAKRISYPCLRSSRRGVAHAHIGLRYSLLWRRAHAAVLKRRQMITSARTQNRQKETDRGRGLAAAWTRVIYRAPAVFTGP
jgi:hypothetical protein